MTSSLLLRENHFDMVDVRETYSSGNRMIVVHNDNENNSSTVYTPEEAEELRDQLNELL